MLGDGGEDADHSLFEDAGAVQILLKKVEDRKATLVNRMLDDVIDQDTFKERKAKLRDEAEQIKVEIRATELEGIELEKVLAFADRLIQYPDRLWGESSLGQRQRLQKTLFPNVRF